MPEVTATPNLDLTTSLLQIVHRVGELEAERNELLRLNDLLSARVAELEDGTGREFYRRGYYAGHAAGHRGAPCITNPETKMRQR